jgi:hypothetical protein
MLWCRARDRYREVSMVRGSSEQRELAMAAEFAGVFRAGIVGRLAITAWLGQVNMDSVEAYARFIQSFTARLAGGRGSIVHLLTERVALPSSGARSALAKLTENSEPVACASVVIEGSGFWASAMRGFLTGMRLLGPSSIRIHEHATPADVVAWLPAEHEKLTGEHLDPDELAHYLEIAKRWQTVA